MRTAEKLIRSALVWWLPRILDPAAPRSIRGGAARGRGRSLVAVNATLAQKGGGMRIFTTILVLAGTAILFSFIFSHSLKSHLHGLIDAAAEKELDRLRKRHARLRKRIDELRNEGGPKPLKRLKYDPKNSRKNS